MTKSFSYQHVQLSYRTEGEGKAVVLIHGFGEDHHIWDLQVAFLKDHCRLIVPDLAGSGSSTGNNTETHAHLSVEDHADMIHALLRYENIDGCIMLGHSMGGYITLAFAEKHAAWLTGFGLVHSTALADSEEKKKNRRRGIAMMEQYGGTAFLKTTIPNLFGEAFKKEHPEKINELMDAADHFNTQELQNYYRAMMRRPDRTHVLKSNPLPVLFVIGTEDIAAPLQDVLPQTYLPFKSYIHILDKVGHMGMWEASSALNHHLLEYINS